MLSSLFLFKGRLIAYTTGEENTYFIERISNGLLYTLTYHFTCDKPEI
jgi:hypothetical protein